jgi:hypothetical protein
MNLTFDRKVLGAFILCFLIVVSPFSVSLAGGDVSAIDPTVLPLVVGDIARLMLVYGSSCPPHVIC